ncbi:MAG: immunoglobulin domain-containing protein [Phycisphaerae bacterium]|nr:immunoglobulin domain-containing protein [Phycisphaerae bacterium]
MVRDRILSAVKHVVLGLAVVAPLALAASARAVGTAVSITAVSGVSNVRFATQGRTGGFSGVSSGAFSVSQARAGAAAFVVTPNPAWGNLPGSPTASWIGAAANAGTSGFTAIYAVQMVVPGTPGAALPAGTNRTLNVEFLVDNALGSPSSGNTPGLYLGLGTTNSPAAIAGSGGVGNATTPTTISANVNSIVTQSGVYWLYFAVENTGTSASPSGIQFRASLDITCPTAAPSSGVTTAPVVTGHCEEGTTINWTTTPAIPTDAFGQAPNTWFIYRSIHDHFDSAELIGKTGGAARSFVDSDAPDGLVYYWVRARFGGCDGTLSPAGLGIADNISIQAGCGGPRTITTVVGAAGAKIFRGLQADASDAALFATIPGTTVGPVVTALPAFDGTPYYYFATSLPDACPTTPRVQDSGGAAASIPHQPPTTLARCLPAPAGDTAVQISVTAAGQDLQYQWLFTPASPPASPEVELTSPSATTPTLVISPPTLADAGSYRCRISSGTDGAACPPVYSNACNLNVGSIAIVSSPSTRAVCETGTWVAHVEVNAADAQGGPLQYEWRRNLVPLADVPGNVSGSSTATLTISNASFANGGSYTCIISRPGGACGPVTTPAAVLFVIGPCACNPADIATEGNPDPFGGPDGSLTGTDFDMFIQGFFQDLLDRNGELIADLTNSDGTGPRDGLLTGSDFDFFIQKFFEGCPG